MLIDLWYRERRRLFESVGILVSYGDFYLPGEDSFFPVFSFLSEALSDFLRIHGTAEGLQNLNIRNFVGKRKFWFSRGRKEIKV